MKKCLLLLSCLLIFGCNDLKKTKRIPVEPDNGIGNGATPPKVLSFLENIEEAHNKPAFMNHKAIRFNITLIFGDTERLNGKVSMTVNSGKVRLDKSDGTRIVYNGKSVYISPEYANMQGARFDIFTWQYFFALPFKLTDSGTVWETQQPRELKGKQYETARLSFEANTGDSPDDWYIIYKDPETNRLKSAAYIVTFSTEPAKAEENPHAIIYSDYEMIENAAISTHWEFYNWSKKEGLGKKLGEAEISDISFFDPAEDYFSKPENATLVTK